MTKKDQIWSKLIKTIIKNGQNDQKRPKQYHQKWSK